MGASSELSQSPPLPSAPARSAIPVEERPSFIKAKRKAEAAQAQFAQIAAKLRAADPRARNRRLIIIGALVEKFFKREGRWDEIVTILDTLATRPRERQALVELIDLDRERAKSPKTNYTSPFRRETSQPRQTAPARAHYDDRNAQPPASITGALEAVSASSSEVRTTREIAVSDQRSPAPTSPAEPAKSPRAPILPVAITSPFREASPAVAARTTVTLTPYLPTRPTWRTSGS